MQPYFIRLIALFTTALSLTGCKILIQVPEGGEVVSVSGTYQCAEGSDCMIEVTDLLFDETFEVITDEGYSFAGWRKGDGYLCGGFNAPCPLFTSFFGDSALLMALLESDEVYFLEPVIRESFNGQAGSTNGVHCNYSDSTVNTQPSLTYTSTSEWTCTDSGRVLSANGIPDHEVGTFPNPNNPHTIAEQDVSVTYTLEPELGTTATSLGGPRGTTGYVLNGVKIDADTAGSCDDSGTSCSLADNAGNWSIEALGQTSFNFGTDANNAHVQPGGSYHYHGMPEGFIAKRGANSSSMTLIGWAADGFPIYARYGHEIADDASSTLTEMHGSYRLVSEVSRSRPSTTDYRIGST